MAALGIDFSDREPMTVHVSTPGRFNLVGQQKPPALIAADEAQQKAWKEYEDSIGNDNVSIERRDLLFSEALRLEGIFRGLQQEWNHSFTLSIK